jgi:hypothetical protein
VIRILLAGYLARSQSDYRIIVIRPPGVEYLLISWYCGTLSFSLSPSVLPSGWRSERDWHDPIWN